MKYFLTCLALGTAFAAGAQTWNPDANFNSIVDVDDLMALLSVFGTEWTEDYPSDSTYDLAAYHAGEFNLLECKRVCYSNGARIIASLELAVFQDSIQAIVSANGSAWISTKLNPYGAMKLLMYDDGYWPLYTDNGDIDSQAVSLSDSIHCFCTGLVPAVE